MSKTWKVVLRDRNYYVEGLKPEYSATDERDTLLLYHYTFPESETPDIGDPSDSDKMLGALYDLHQVQGGFSDGDFIETPFGMFIVQGVHVCPVE